MTWVHYDYPLYIDIESRVLEDYVDNDQCLINGATLLYGLGQGHLVRWVARGCNYQSVIYIVRSFWLITPTIGEGSLYEWFQPHIFCIPGYINAISRAVSVRFPVKLFCLLVHWLTSPSVERQTGLNINHLYIKLNPFVITAIVITRVNCTV